MWTAPGRGPLPPPHPSRHTHHPHRDTLIQGSLAEIKAKTDDSARCSFFTCIQHCPFLTIDWKAPTKQIASVNLGSLIGRFLQL